MSEQDLNYYKWYREREFRRLARIGEFRNYGRTSGGGESAKPVLLFLLVAVAFALASGTPLISVLVGAPILVIGFALVSCVAGVLFGGVGVVALIIFAALSLLA